MQSPKKQKKVGNYILTKELGKGQFGNVYKAHLVNNTKQIYAVKVILKRKLKQTPILERLFNTEIGIMKKIDHPNIMRLYEFMETEKNYYLVIRYCNNGDLEEYLNSLENNLSEKGGDECDVY